MLGVVEQAVRLGDGGVNRWDEDTTAMPKLALATTAA